MRLIDAELLKHEMIMESVKPILARRNLLTIIDDAPSLEIEPALHGRWIELAMTGEYKCSVCGRGSRSENTFQLIPKVYWNYCPNCGAKMEGKV